MFCAFYECASELYNTVVRAVFFCFKQLTFFGSFHSNFHLLYLISISLLCERKDEHSKAHHHKKNQNEKGNSADLANWEYTHIQKDREREKKNEQKIRREREHNEKNKYRMKIRDMLLWYTYVHFFLKCTVSNATATRIKIVGIVFIHIQA